MPARDRQAGFSVQLSVRAARQRHSQIEVVRPATKRWACPHRNHDAEDQRTALPADLGRGFEMAARARRDERQRFYLSVDARGDGERHAATLGESRRNNQTHLVSLLKSFANLLFIGNEHCARIYFLIGNDLETSEFLYSTSFCINSKRTRF